MFNILRNKTCVLKIDDNYFKIKGVLSYDIGEKTFCEFLDIINSTISIKNVILDLSNVLFIDSSGMVLIFKLYKSCKGLDKSFCVYCVCSKIRQLFQVTNLDKSIPIITRMD